MPRATTSFPSAASSHSIQFMPVGATSSFDCAQLHSKQTAIKPKNFAFWSWNVKACLGTQQASPTIGDVDHAKADLTVAISSPFNLIPSLEIAADEGVPVASIDRPSRFEAKSLIVVA